jgi:hypothetical protein
MSKQHSKTTDFNKQLFTTFIGATLGAFFAFLATWYWQSKNQHRLESNIAIVLRQSVINQTNSAQLISELVYRIATNHLPSITPEYLVPSLTSPLYLETRPKAIELDPEVVAAVITFDQFCSQAELYRNLAQKDHDEHHTKIEQNIYLAIYLRSLHDLSLAGAALIETIDRRYPEIHAPEFTSHFIPGEVVGDSNQPFTSLHYPSGGP